MRESMNLSSKWVILMAALLTSVGAIATDKEREKSTSPTTRIQTEKPVDAVKRQPGELPKERQKSVDPTSREKTSGSTPREKTSASSSRKRSAK